MTNVFRSRLVNERSRRNPRLDGEMGLVPIATPRSAKVGIGLVKVVDFLDVRRKEFWMLGKKVEEARGSRFHRPNDQEIR